MCVHTAHYNRLAGQLQTRLNQLCVRSISHITILVRRRLERSRYKVVTRHASFLVLDKSSHEIRQ
jgi:hypothetical protein